MVTHHRDLYLADSEALAQRLRQTDPHVRRVMLVGHNPSLRLLVGSLTRGLLINSVGARVLVVVWRDWGDAGK